MRQATLGLLCAVLTFQAGCATTASSPSTAAQPAASEEVSPWKGTWERFEADPRVGRYTSIPWGFSTASYWIEGPEGVVLIDTQFLPSAAEEALTIAEQVTGKKVVMAVVLHANPDKFNGTAVYQARGIDVVTSAQVLALIPGIHEKRTRAFYDRYAPDYPSELPEPRAFGDADTTLTAGGLALNAHLMGPGCSFAHVVIEWEGHVFVGDLVANGAHSWLEIGQTDEWLHRLDEIEALKPRFVHPGRGESGGPELLASERSYLSEVIRLVAEGHPTDPEDEAGIEAARGRVEAAFPDLKNPYFLRIGIPAEWRRQAAAAAASE